MSHDAFSDVYEAEEKAVIAWSEEKQAEDKMHETGIFAALETHDKKEQDMAGNAERSNEEFISYILYKRDLTTFQSGNEIKPLPTFIAVTSWYALYDDHKTWYALDAIIRPADEIGDAEYSRDQKRGFGFDDNGQGLLALRTLYNGRLRGKIPCDFYIRDEEGAYGPLSQEFLENLQEMEPIIVKRHSFKAWECERVKRLSSE